MRRLLVVVVSVAALSACGSASPDGSDKFRDNCQARGGTYVDSEWDADQCIYG